MVSRATNQTAARQVMWCKTHDQLVQYRADPCDYNDPTCDIVWADVVVPE